MAGKKSKKKSAAARGDEFLDSSSLGMLQNLLGSLPPEAQQDLLATMLGGGPPGELFLPPLDSPPRPQTKAQREIDRLVNEARCQDTTNDAIPLLVQAEAAAKKAIGKRWDKLVGQFGDDPAGDAYLEVRLELAEALNAADQREAALAHLEEIYRLDPADPFQARILLLVNYLELDRTESATKLLSADATEPWAAWMFGRVLLALRRGERGPATADALKAAQRLNPYVLSLLLNERMPDPVPPMEIETGEDSEAQDYAAYFLAAWRNTPGAISWLRETALRLNLEIMPPVEAAGPAKRVTAREFAKLPPHEHPVWIAGVHNMGKSQLVGEGEAQPHWLTFAFSPDNDLIGFDISDDKPAGKDLWDRLTDFMLSEEQEGRPEKIRLYPPALVKSLEKDAKRAKIAVEPFEESEQLTTMLAELSDRMAGGAQVAATIDPELIRNAPLDVDEVWEAAIVQLDRRIDVGGQSLRPWIALVMSRSGGVILWHELFVTQPPEGALSNALRMAVARPAVGEARRPRQVIVRDHDEAVSVAALSDELGFDCVVEHDLPLVADAVNSLTSELLGGDRSAVLVKGEGTTPADLEQFYTAAAVFYRAAPWKRFAMDEVVGLERSEAPGQRYYALVMGQSGITQGIAIYERIRDVKAMFANNNERKVFDSFSVMFGEDLSIAPADLDAIEQFGWPVATPEAYPDALRIHPGPQPDSPRVETPTGEELRFLTATLEAITWLAKHREEKTITVTNDKRSLVATRLGGVGRVHDTAP